MKENGFINEKLTPKHEEKRQQPPLKNKKKCMKKSPVRNRTW